MKDWIIISGQFSATVNAAFTPNASQDSKNRKSLIKISRICIMNL